MRRLVRESHCTKGTDINKYDLIRSVIDVVTKLKQDEPKHHGFQSPDTKKQACLLTCREEYQPISPALSARTVKKEL